MVDDLDKECTREELYAMIDSLRDRLRALNAGLRTYNKMPDPVTLKAMGSFAKFPHDWKLGRQVQIAVGLDLVPPKSECEAGAGFWARINHLTPEEIRKMYDVDNEQEKDVTTTP